MLNCGVFTFSLDFELAWGTRETKPLATMRPYLQGTRAAIYHLLQLFEKYEISATWATVGAILLNSTNEKHPWLRKDNLSDVPEGNNTTQPFWYGEDIVESILSCKVPQELGCHTLTHPLVSRNSNDRGEFRTELKRFLELFEKKNIERPISFIYPKAQMRHFDILAELGFRCFRGPENRWYEKIPGTFSSAAFRFFDAILALQPQVKKPQKHPSGLWVIPSSQFYSPFMRVGKYVSVRARVRKAIRGLHKAVETNGVFHLWAHPFNLGVCTNDLLTGLDIILSEAQNLRTSGKLDILPMGSLAKKLDSKL